MSHAQKLNACTAENVEQQEVVVDRLFDGKTQLTRALEPLVLVAERTLRMVRDVFHVNGFLLADACGQLAQIVLNQTAPLASSLVHPLRSLLACAPLTGDLAKLRYLNRRILPTV